MTDTQSALQKFETALTSYTAANHDRHTQTDSRLHSLEMGLKRPFMAGFESGLSEMGRDHKKAFLSYVRKGDESAVMGLQLKSLSTTVDGDGGFLIPQVLMSQLGQKMENLSPIREIANVIPISSSALELLIDHAGGDVAWVEESAARAETDTPTLDKKRIPVHELYAKPRATQKLLDDTAVNVESWLIEKVSTRMAQLENRAFILGDGQNKPTGFLNYASNVAARRARGELEHFLSGADGAFAGDDRGGLLIDTMTALRPEYQRGAVWVMSRSAHSTIRKMRDANGQFLWQPGLGEDARPTLLGYPVVLSEDMPALAAGTASKSIVFGNFKEAYVIVDRHDMRILRDPYSAKPHVEFYTTKRVGGDVVNLDALKIINFSA